jgi:hypothetical protein
MTDGDKKSVVSFASMSQQSSISEKGLSVVRFNPVEN